MPVNVSEEFIAGLGEDVLYIAVCCRVQRSDGYIQGFTSWQHDLTIDEDDEGTLLYRSGNGMTSTALEQIAGTGVDNAVIQWFYQNEWVSERDIRAGLYASAILEMFIFFPNNPERGKMRGPRGEFGKVTLLDNNSAQMEFRSRFQRTQMEVIDLASSDCRVKNLGDSRCKFDLSGLTEDGYKATIETWATEVTDRRIFAPTFNSIVNTPAGEADLYNWDSAYVTWLTGPNVGASTPVYSFDGVRCIMQLNDNIVQVPKAGETGVINNAIKVSDLSSHNFNFTALTVRQESSNAFSFVVNPTFWPTPAPEGGVSFPESFFRNGLVTFNTGQNRGISREVMTFDDDGFTLQEEMPFDIIVGDQFTAIVGCDRRVQTCKSRFGNVINFRGEPFIKPFEKVAEVQRIGQNFPNGTFLP